MVELEASNSVLEAAIRKMRGRAQELAQLQQEVPRNDASRFVDGWEAESATAQGESAAVPAPGRSEVPATARAKPREARPSSPAQTAERAASTSRSGRCIQQQAGTSARTQGAGDTTNEPASGAASPERLGGRRLVTVVGAQEKALRLSGRVPPTLPASTRSFSPSQLGRVLDEAGTRSLSPTQLRATPKAAGAFDPPSRARAGSPLVNGGILDGSAPAGFVTCGTGQAKISKLASDGQRSSGSSANWPQRVSSANVSPAVNNGERAIHGSMTMRSAAAVENAARRRNSLVTLSGGSVAEPQRPGPLSPHVGARGLALGGRGPAQRQQTATLPVPASTLCSPVSRGSAREVPAAAAAGETAQPVGREMSDDQLLPRQGGHAPGGWKSLPAWSMSSMTLPSPVPPVQPTSRTGSVVLPGRSVTTQAASSQSSMILASKNSVPSNAQSPGNSGTFRSGAVVHQAMSPWAKYRSSDASLLTSQP